MERLVVVEVDGYPELFRRQLHPVEEELPGPGDGLLLEVVADAEVAQHLEEGQVGGIAHRLDIGGAEALLAGRQAPAGGFLLPQEVGLYLHHAGRGQQQRGVAFGHQGGAGNDFMSLLLEEFQKHRSYLVAVHVMAPGKNLPVAYL
ncbi:MAG: hypothetical protein A2Z05_03905 [Chloroflexi bacterium RBG_16_60_22]|nr:MAG: hypothetical protein A2Z05_03905 [Chloroflexi bacterium RBG_16_60_22]